MMRVTALLVLAKLSLSSAAVGSFSYDRTAKNGPHSWSKLSKSTECDAPSDEQSPRDLCGAKIADLKLGAQDTWKYTGPLVVFNNGHTIQVNFDQKNPPTTINKLADNVGRSKDLGDQTWNVAQVHFHWQTYEGYGGSEHLVAGSHYPMEAHFVHYNAKYKSLGGAVASGKKDALLVIGVFLSISEKESGFISSIGDAIPGATRKPATYKYDSADFTKFAEANILAKDAVFYNYAGGLTTPTCNEIVTWVVMERSCMVTKATLKKFLDASTDPKGRRLQAFGESMSISESEFEGKPLALTRYPMAYQITQANLKGFLEATKPRKLRALADTIGKFGNYRPVSLNKGPVYLSRDASAKGRAKCAYTYAEAKMYFKTMTTCPKFSAFGQVYCNDGADKPCRRAPTELEFAAICAEILFDPKCSKDPNPDVKMFGEHCPKYEWRVDYPSCKRGYWASGCGQPALKQKARGVKCYGVISKPSLFVFEAPDGCTGPKPKAVDRVCPATPACPRCKGCKRNGSCWKACDNKAGFCSACNSKDGQMGACCKPGAKGDPIECKLARYQFENHKEHTCALLLKDMHVGYVFKEVFERLAKVEAEVDKLKK